MVKVVTAPEEFIEDPKLPSIFLAGGISDCPDWHSEIMFALKDTKCILINPKRSQFDLKDPKNSVEQINWEFKNILKADAVSFWFPKESICPIILFELGSVLGRLSQKNTQKIYLGTDKEYVRRFDIIEQVRNICNITYGLSIDVLDSLHDLINAIKEGCSWAQ